MSRQALTGRLDKRIALDGRLSKRIALTGKLDSFEPPVTIPLWALPAGIVDDDVVAAYDFAAADSLEESYINLEGTSEYNLLPLDPVPAWNAADGLVMDGNHYLDSDITPAGDQTWSFLVWADDGTVNSASENGLFGSGNATNTAQSIYISRFSTQTFFRYGALANTAVIGWDNDAMLALAGSKGYINDVLAVTLGAPSVGVQTYPLRVGAGVGANGPFGYSRKRIRAFAVWNSVLTDVQVAAVGAALRANNANWWTAGGATGAVAAYRFVGAASFAAARVNLVSPGVHDLTLPGRGVTFEAGLGLRHDKLKLGALDTGIVPPLVDHSWSMVVQVADVVAISAIVGMLGDPATRSFSIQYGSSPSFIIAHNGGQLFNNAAGRPPNAVVALGGNVVYVNAVSIGTTPAPSGGIIRSLLLLGGRQSNGCVSIVGSNLLLKRVVIYRQPLTAGQVTEVTNAMNAS